MYIAKWVMCMNSRVKIVATVLGVLVVAGVVFFVTRPSSHKTATPPPQSVVYGNGGSPSQSQILQEEKKLFPVVSPPSTARGQAQASVAKQVLTKPTTTPNNSTTPGGGDAYGYPIGTETGSVPNPPVILPTVKVDASVPSWATEGALVAGSWDLGLYMCDPATIVNADNYVVENVKQLSRCVGVSTAGLTGSATVALDPSSTANGLPLAMYDVTTTIMGGGQGVTGTDQVQVAYTNLGVYVVSAKFGVGTATSSGGTP